MKTKTKYALPALMLCIGAFLTPVTAFAAGGTGADTTPPTVSAEVMDGMVHIEASDDDSGVDAVYIGEKRINYRVDGAIDLDFADFVKDGQETVGIYAVDFAGNQSSVVEVKNPGYQTPAPEPEQKPLTPDGQASVLDNATDQEGKEFYTFTTPDENVFYLVIDRQRESENVYFLNAVTERDLLELAEKDKEGGAGGESAIPAVEVCSCTKQCVAGKVDTACPVCKNDLKSCTGEPEETEAPEEERPEKPKKGSGGTFLFILLAALAAGGAGYYLKVYKPKHDLDDAEDLDDLLDEEEPEINEDEPEQAGTGEMEQPGMDAALYDDYPEDDYPEDGPEQEG